MKVLAVIAGLLILSSANAQTTGVKIDNIDSSSEDTTISIKKGSSAAKAEKKFEIIDGDGEIVSDGKLLRNEAQESWKKACESWKKEIREDNKDNKILAINCGSQTCAPENGQTVCKSKGTYKLKVKMAE